MLIRPRSLLFVPASRPDRFAKAFASGADLVCIDLEDAVAPKDKAGARQTFLQFVADFDAAQETVAVGVRINPLTSPLGINDVAALLGADLGQLSFVMLPKVEHAEVIRWAAELFPEHLALVPIIESAQALSQAEQAFAHPRVSAAIFGAVDYSADVGCDLSFTALQVPRVQLINAAAIHDVTLLDVPYVDVSDLDGLRKDVLQTRALGMRARSAIHPTQIDVIHTAFAPSAAERAYAQRVLEAFELAEGGVALLDGKLIELPVIKAARRVLE